MKRLIVLAMGLGLLAAACGEDGAEPLGPAPRAERSPDPMSSPIPRQSPTREESPPADAPEEPTEPDDPVPQEEEPQTEEDGRERPPSIVVDTPTAGEAISSPITIAGSADVYEATVSIRILDANGREIVRTFTTATCGSGCRGDYLESVEYRVLSKQPGTIEVFESSAVDGSRTNVVSIPVMLNP